jgi:hypothetical protein
MKTRNIDKIDRFLIQNLKNEFKQNSVNQNDKSIDFSDLSISFVDLLIGFLTHRSVLSSKIIYRLFNLSIYQSTLLIYQFLKLFNFFRNSFFFKKKQNRNDGLVRAAVQCEQNRAIPSPLPKSTPFHPNPASSRARRDYALWSRLRRPGAPSASSPARGRLSSTTVSASPTTSASRAVSFDRSNPSRPPRNPRLGIAPAPSRSRLIFL